jgi:anaerobic magnesium-protoporphyrin IX monomethyl ester cyclase
MPQLDLLVIHPGSVSSIYGVLGEDLVAVEPPLWARLIAGYVRDRGFSVHICDAEALGLSPIHVAELAKLLSPRLICLAVYGHQPSASTQQMVGASATAREIKKLWPESTIIMTGGHVSALPERTLREEAIDYACVGEGPVTIVELLSKWGLQEGREFYDSVPGLVWRNKLHSSGITINKSAPLIEDLSHLHGNVWDLLPMHLYKAHNWQVFGSPDQRQPYASVYTTLGCPYSCSFCCIAAPFESRRYRMRKSEDVVNEIKHLYYYYNVHTFKIVDEMFVLNERHYTAIAQGLIDVGLGPYLNIWAYSRIDTVKEGNLSLLRRAGFKWLALGIESASAYVRDGAAKKMRNDDIVGVVRSIQAHDINVIDNYIFGLPDDDHASMQETLDLAVELNTEFSNFYVAQAYPGSPLYAQAVKEGWALPETWEGYSQHNPACRPLDTKHLSAKEVLAFRDAAFQTYFSNPRYQDMILEKFGIETLKHVQLMLTYKLERELLAA